jgi:hypothetical protein
MTTANLIAHIGNHGIRARELPDGRILAEEVFTVIDPVRFAASGQFGPYFAAIEANSKAVRDWLGY